MTFTMSGNSGFLPGQSGIRARVSEGSRRSAPPIRGGGRATDGRDQCAESRALMAFLQPNPVLQISTGATANHAGAIRLCAFRNRSERGLCDAGQADAEDVRVSRVSVRQLRPVQPHAQSAGRICCATRPSCTAFPKRASRRCCTTPTRRTTPT